MRVLLLLALMLQASCGVKNSSYKMGKTTRSEVISQEGDNYKEEAIPNKDSILLVFPETEAKFQFKNDVLVNSFKNPQGNEKQLIYWKHKFKECGPVTKTLPQDPAAHTPPEIEMSCSSEGVSIIYTQGSDIVTRVVEHEAK